MRPGIASLSWLRWFVVTNLFLATVVFISTPTCVFWAGEHQRKARLVYARWARLDRAVPRFGIPTARGPVDLDRLRPGSVMEGANLRDARWTGIRLPGVIFKICDFGRADLRAADLRETRVLQCNLRGADLRNANLRGALVVLCDLREADLRRAGLQPSALPISAHSWEVTQIRGCDLRQARLAGALVGGLLFDSATQWPAEFDPYSKGAHNTWED